MSIYDKWFTVIEITDANGTVFEYDLSAYVM